jgi:hypothetical protein
MNKGKSPGDSSTCKSLEFPGGKSMKIKPLSYFPKGEKIRKSETLTFRLKK